MAAEVRRGHLEYRDERGSYRIPIGRRGRKCLAILDKREGEFVRSLEVDLFTGFVYYCVDNATSGGLSYYYDMSSKKVGHYFIHRYLRNARNHGVDFTPLESEIFEKLPCSNWVEELGRLPGWKDAIDHRVENLLLPARQVLSIRVNEKIKENPHADKSNLSVTEISLISFTMYPASYPSGIREQVYAFERQDPDHPAILLYRNKNVGNEFFGEDAEYEICLTEKEESMIRTIAENILEGGKADCLMLDSDNKSGTAAEGPLSASEALEILREEHDGEKMILKEVTVRYTDGSEKKLKVNEGGECLPAENLRTVLHGMLRREVNLL